MLIGAALPQFILRAADQSHGDEAFFDNEDLIGQAVLLSFDWRAVIEAAGFVSPWWPWGGIIGGAYGFDGDNLTQLSPRHSDIWRSFGANGRLAFVGYTRDQFGSPIGGVTVRCFRTSTDEMVSKVTSDDNGFYIATSPYSDAHFLTVHKAGSPDLSGSSVDTVLPA